MDCVSENIRAHRTRQIGGDATCLTTAAFVEH